MKKKLLALGFCLASAAGVGYAADGDKTGIMVPADLWSNLMRSTIEQTSSRLRQASQRESLARVHGLASAQLPAKPGYRRKDTPRNQCRTRLRHSIGELRL